MINTKTILGVGSIALDTLETPNGNKKNLLGGSATYFSIAASMLAKVKLVGIVGNDFPQLGWDLFQDYEINIDNVSIENGNTFKWGGRYNQDYSIRETLFTDLGVFENFSPTIIQEDQNISLVFLGNIQPDLQLKVAKTTKRAKYIVSDTMNLWIDLFPERLKEVFSISSIFLINHEEAEQLTGEVDVVKAGQKLLSMGPKVIVIKRGADGAFLISNKCKYYIPAYNIKNIIDPTGAGDSFAGGFMGYLANNEGSDDFFEAVVTGSAIASFCVENFGVDGLLNMSLQEIEYRKNMIKNLADMSLV